MAASYGILEISPIGPSAAQNVIEFIQNTLSTDADFLDLQTEYTVVAGKEELPQHTLRISYGHSGTKSELQTILSIIEEEATARKLTVTKKKALEGFPQALKRILIRYGSEVANRPELFAALKDMWLEHRTLAAETLKIVKQHFKDLGIGDFSGFKDLVRSTKLFKYRQEPKEFLTGYFLFNFSDVSALGRDRWLQPGTFYNQLDESPEEVRDAWFSLPRIDRWRIRLFKEANTFQHNSNGFLHIGVIEVPSHLKDEVITLVQNSSEIAYLGRTREIAEQTLAGLGYSWEDFR